MSVELDVESHMRLGSHGNFQSLRTAPSCVVGCSMNPARAAMLKSDLRPQLSEVSTHHVGFQFAPRPARSPGGRGGEHGAHWSAHCLSGAAVSGCRLVTGSKILFYIFC